MFKHILVPLDGSGRAEQALPVAAKLAHATGAAITLLRIVDTSPVSAPSADAKPILLQAVSESDIRLAQSYLDSIAASDRFTHIHVATRVVVGIVSSTILSEAVTQQADIIIICSHGLTGVSRWALGSIAEKVARYGTLPTLVLREGGPMLDKTTTSIRVLVPLDGSSQSETALEPATQLATALSAPEQGALHLLHVVKPAFMTQVSKGMTSDAEESPANIHMAKQYLDATMSNVASSSGNTASNEKLAMTSLVVSNSDVAHTIIQEAEHGSGSTARNADIIAMTAYGNNGPQHWALGSITERVLHSTRLPLFIVQPARNSRG